MRYYEAPTILIGGDGADDVEGASGGDCLIGGSTTFDANLTVLRSLLAEWVRTDVAYADKVARWWTPDDVVFVDDIPLGSTGKMLKSALREQFRDHPLPTV